MDFKMRSSTFKIVFLKVHNSWYVTWTENLALPHLTLIARLLGMKANTFVDVQSLNHVRLFCDLMDKRLPGSSLCSWDFPSKNTGVGSQFLLQGMKPCLTRIVYHWATKINNSSKVVKIRKTIPSSILLYTVITGASPKFVNKEDTFPYEVQKKED